jgi:hypothetical protein
MWSWSELATTPPLHYVVVSKECVIEVVAADVDLVRIGGAPSDAVAKSLGPGLDR